MKKKNFQLFADLSSIMGQHTDVFPDGNDFGARFDDIQSQLKQLGYDLLINNRSQAEFVPASRLSEVISQRDTFKGQAEKAIKELEAFKQQPGISPEAQSQIDTLIANNKDLLDSLKQANVRIGIMTEFDDAMDPSDIVQFIDQKKLKIDASGNITGGLDVEHERLKGEKPYLFKTKPVDRKRAGVEGSAPSDSEKLTMNTLIRRKAYGNPNTNL